MKFLSKTVALLYFADTYAHRHTWISSRGVTRDVIKGRNPFMKAQVTGGAGFLGSHLCDCCIWWISDVSKFKFHYPGWSYKYNLKTYWLKYLRTAFSPTSNKTW